MKKGIHPARNLTRIVMSNGAVVWTQMAWQRPDPSAIATKFLEVDITNHETFTGVKSRTSTKVGQRERFEKKFAVSAESQQSSQKSSQGLAELLPDTDESKE